MASLKLEPAGPDIKPGTEVIRVDDSGRPHLTRTRSGAWCIGDHNLVMVEGVSGGYLIERIFVMPERT